MVGMFEDTNLAALHAKMCYNHAKGHSPSTTLAWQNFYQTRCRGGKVTGLAYYTTFGSM